MKEWICKCNTFLVLDKYYFIFLISRGISQSVQRLATGWTVRGSNPGGGEIFLTRPDRPWDSPSLLYNGYRVFPGGKAAGAWRWTPPPSSAGGMEEWRPSWPVIGWSLPLPLPLYVNVIIIVDDFNTFFDLYRSSSGSGFGLVFCVLQLHGNCWWCGVCYWAVLPLRRLLAYLFVLFSVTCE